MKKHEDDITTETITHLSLCSGYEGIGLGLRRVFPNLREIAYVEREGFPVANLVAKMETGELDAAPVFTDVKTFPYGKFRGIVDILSGGFPCQPFSTAGKREGVEDPRHLFPYIANGIRECRPRLVFLENVEGIISSKTADGESVLKYVLSELEGLGYRATAGIFSAAEVGAPHQRKRVFILAHCDSVRHDRRELSDRNGERSLPEQAQSRPGQPVVWSEAEGCCGESRSETELAHSKGERTMRETRTSGHETKRPGRTLSREPQRSGCRTEELANSQCVRRADLHNEGIRESSEQISLIDGCSREVITPKELDNTNLPYGEGGGIPSGIHKEHANTHSASLWPAHPGEEQHDWEEPRVVADSRLLGQKKQEQQATGADQQSDREQDKYEAESELGRTTHGSSSRVDRLRLLGNGVVPQVAAKAFVTLFNRFK